MKKRLLLFAIITLTFSIVGCSSSKSNRNAYSSDYCGLEPGFELRYQVSDTDQRIDNGETKKSTMSLNTIDLGNGILKTINVNDLSAGGLILKKNNSYYDYGTWYANGDVDIYPEPYDLIVTNQITTSLTGSLWGTVKGQEPITVKGGTFTAWVFEKVEDIQRADYTSKGVFKVWFVPYLGIVKETYNQWRNGEHITENILELTSFAKGVKIQDTSLRSAQSQSVAPTRSDAPSSLMKLFGKHVH